MSSITWYQPVWLQLMDYVGQERLPHALLISGIPGIGKKRLAKAFAQRLLCTNPTDHGMACNQCSNCLLYQANTHPDYRLVEPAESGKMLSIDAIRSIIDTLALTPQYSGYRIILLATAHRMSIGAANSLLKTLEEPPDRSLIILITEAPYQLPATIISRCQRFHLNPPTHRQALAWLAEQTDNNNLDALLAMTQGAPLKALDLAETGQLEVRNECFQEWRGLGQFTVDPIVVAEKWTKLPEDDLLLWLTTWIADMIRLWFCSDFENVFNPDLRTSLQAVANRLNLKQLFKFWESLLLAKQQLSTQVNKQLLLEELLIEWCDINQRI